MHSPGVSITWWLQAPGHADGQTLPSELVDHRQQPQVPAIVSARFHKVLAPDMVWFLRSQPDTGPVVQLQPSMRLVLGWDLQPFPPPDVLDPVLAHIPSGLFQQNGNSSVAQPAILTGQCDDRLGELIFVVALRRPIALCSPRLVHQPTRLPFTESLVPSVLDGDAAPLGTQESPWAMSFRICFSTVRSATARQD
jgi:hypothetical protein